MLKAFIRAGILIIGAVYLIGLSVFVTAAPWQVVVFYIISTIVSYLMGKYWRPIKWTKENAV